MKKILAPAIVLLLALACSLPAFAEPVDADGEVYSTEVSQPTGGAPDLDGEVLPAAPLSEEEEEQMRKQEEQQRLDRARAKLELEAARDEILALSATDGNILAVKLGEKQNGVLFVGIAEGHEKEYARRFVERYGSFVVVTNDVELADAAAPVLGVESGLNLESVILPATPLASHLWPWLIVGLAVFGMACAVLFGARRGPALQTAGGNVFARRAAVSRKEAVSSVKENEASPGDRVFDDIMREIGGG
jgi:hypothetical protein